MQRRSSAIAIENVTRIIAIFCVLVSPALALSDDKLAAKEMNDRGAAEYFGLGVDENKKAGCLLFEKAAKLGDGNALFNLGNCFKDGVFGEVNLARAEESYIESASLGVNNAFVALGVIGIGSNNTYAGFATANQFFRVALVTDPGNSVAQFHYGVSLLIGRGAAQNIERAIELIRMSSADGYDLGVVMDIYLFCETYQGEEIDGDDCENSKIFYDQAQSSIDGASYDETIKYFGSRGWLPAVATPKSMQ